MVGRRERVVRIVSAGVALVLGVAAAVFGAFIHPAVLVVGEVSLPWGVIGALGVEVGALALAAGLARRVGVWLASSAWLATVLVVTWPRAAGDIVVPGTWYGYAFLGVGIVIAVGSAFAATLMDVPEPDGPSEALPQRR